MAGCGVRRLQEPWQDAGDAKPLPRPGSSSSEALGEAADAPRVPGSPTATPRSTSTPQHPWDFPFPSTAVNPALGTKQVPHKPPPSASYNPG